MKRKRRIDTCKVYKWKARLNVHGEKKEFGVNYWETYSQVLGWPEIRFFLVLSAIKGCSSRQIYFFLVFTKDKIECKMYMDTPKGFIFTE